MGFYALLFISSFIALPFAVANRQVFDKLLAGFARKYLHQKSSEFARRFPEDASYIPEAVASQISIVKRREVLDYLLLAGGLGLVPGFWFLSAFFFPRGHLLALFFIAIFFIVFFFRLPHIRKLKTFFGVTYDKSYADRYLRAIVYEAARIRKPGLLPFLLGEQSLPWHLPDKSLLRPCSFFYLFDLKEKRFITTGAESLIALKKHRRVIEERIASGQYVFAQNTTGYLNALNDVEYDPDTRSLCIVVWNDAANELDRERLRYVQKVVVDAPRADFPFDWAVVALLEAIENESLQIELEIPRPERLNENTKRLLREASRG